MQGWREVSDRCQSPFWSLALPRLGSEGRRARVQQRSAVKHMPFGFGALRSSHGNLSENLGPQALAKPLRSI